MERFTFRLQKVLDHRVRVEDIKKQVFIRARLSYLNEKKGLEKLQCSLNGCTSTPVKSTGVLNYLAKYNYITLLEERIDNQSKVVKVCEDEMNEKKAEFEKSQKDRKVIDKLKENAYGDYNIFIDRLEQKQNDEFALYGYVRK